MRLKKIITFGVVAILSFFTFSTQVYADEQSDNLPHLTLSELYLSDTQEAIITDFDIPDFPAPEVSNQEPIYTILVNLPFGNGGRWIYKYTVDPFSFYQNSVTGEWRTLQTTSTVDHTVYTIVNGVVTRSTSWPTPYYNPAYAHLMGG
ncbi:hypothetical protein Si107_01688 [Streptococcus infantarius subsp. infantarius]|nr:hypothetical protein [Streptococcus infantarius subsp. infantarius]